MADVQNQSYISLLFTSPLPTDFDARTPQNVRENDTRSQYNRADIENTWSAQVNMRNIRQGTSQHDQISNMDQDDFNLQLSQSPIESPHGSNLHNQAQSRPLFSHQTPMSTPMRDVGNTGRFYSRKRTMDNQTGMVMTNSSNNLTEPATPAVPNQQMLETYNKMINISQQVLSTVEIIQQNQQDIATKFAALQKDTEMKTKPRTSISTEISGKLKRLYKRLDKEFNYTDGTSQSPENIEVMEFYETELRRAGYKERESHAAVMRLYENSVRKFRRSLSPEKEVKAKKENKMYQRKNRTLKRRKSTAANKEEEEFWQKVSQELMSDEETDDEDDKTLVLTSPSWRGETLNRACREADQRNKTCSNKDTYKRIHNTQPKHIPFPKKKYSSYYVKPLPNFCQI